MSKTPLVLAIGELLWDVLPTEAVLGGAPANFSYRLSSFNVPCYLVSRVGNDERGETALELIRSKNIYDKLLQKDSTLQTGYVSVSLDNLGNASYIIHTDVAYDNIELNEDLKNAAKEASIICFGTLVQRSPVSRKTINSVLEIAKDATKILDINLRKDCYSKETIESSLRLTDILKLNDEEIFKLKEILCLAGATELELGKELIRIYDLRSCLITRAERGVLAVTQRGEVTDIPGLKVSVVDTIGSGDAFTAGFVAALLKGKSIQECCTLGNILGSEVAKTKGGMSEIIISEALKELVQS